MRTPWALLVAYGLCVLVAALTVPSWLLFLTYGLATWFGGLLFALLWPWLTHLTGRD